ncbi:MAG TPA: hypothetical protein PLI07_12085, partial [Candidatus Hydrogenedentes bacterium]|nr:hypothetical protein [Candidatus Hydrogenedentota bacterium]
MPILAGPALAGPPSLMLSTDFSSLPPGTVVQGSAGLSGGYSQLTPATGSQQGAWYWDPGQVLTTFHLKCDIYMGNGSSPPADGMAFCYGPLNWSSSFGEYGYGNGLRVCMPTYNTNRLIVYYGATTVADIALSSAILVNSRWTQFAIDIDANGTCYVSHDRNLYVYHTISGWNPQAGWTVGVGGRTGGAWELNAIDNLTISKSEPFAVSMTRASANPVVVGASSIDYTTLFNETVFNLGTADFNLTTTGSASAAVASVIGPNFAVNESFASGPGAGTLVGSALITSGELHLTEAVNGQTGRWYLAPRRMAGFYSQFDLYIGGGNGADGFLFAYGPDATSSGIDGPATGLAVSFDTYDNGGEGTPNIVIKHANVERHITSRALRTGSWVPVRINVTTEGLCTVWWNGARCGADVPLPGWNPQTNWFVALSG